MTKNIEPVLPGVILTEDYLTPLKLTQSQLARDIDVPVGRINEIIRNRRRITADTALSLAHYFDTTPDLWLGLQNEYDLVCAKKKLGSQLIKRVPTFREGTPHT